MMDQTTVNRRYEMERKIGEGGMAEVFLGRDLLLHRRVAVKALRPQFASDPGFRARFEREAQAAAGFTHPNIVDIYDVGEEDGTPYLVMEYLQGDTLKEIIAAEGPFHPDDVAALLEQVGAALDYAHERGYVHRDVKPQNIIVDRRGLAKVVDFGIAKGLADSNLTEAGAGLGTVHYISPEQASGLMATPASDIYSLAVVAFEMLTGDLPFDADTAVGVAMRHIHEPPSAPSSVNSDIPDQADEIVLRALAKDPTKRFPSAGAFAHAMTDWRDYPLAAGPGNASREGNAGASAAPRPETVPLPTPIRPKEATSNGRVTVLRPPVARSAQPAVTADRPQRLAPAAAPAESGDEIGCATWLIGSALLVVLVLLIVFGSRLVDRFDSAGGSPDDATEAATTLDAPTAPAGAPPPAAIEPTTTNEPAAAPAETPTAPAEVAVPDLRGMSLADALDAAHDRGFWIEQAEPVFNETYAADTVAEQDPPADTRMAQVQKIVVKLSQGSAAVDLTALDLLGKSPEEAAAILVEQDIAAQRTEVASADVPAGQIVRVQPPDTALAGDTVVIEVSVGDKVWIPAAIRGQPVDQAANQLDVAGLRVVDRKAVDLATLDSNEIDPIREGIQDGDVVGVQGGGADWDIWVDRGTEITLYFYDTTLDPR